MHCTITTNSKNSNHNQRLLPGHLPMPLGEGCANEPQAVVPPSMSKTTHLEATLPRKVLKQCETSDCTAVLFWAVSIPWNHLLFGITSPKKSYRMLNVTIGIAIGRHRTSDIGWHEYSCNAASITSTASRMIQQTCQFNCRAFFQKKHLSRKSPTRFLSTVSDCQPQDFSKETIPTQKASLAGTARPVCFDGDCATGKLVDETVFVAGFLPLTSLYWLYTATVVNSA